MVENDVTKGGVVWFELSMGRSRDGLEVYAKAHPKVEDFVRSLGSGFKEDAGVYGRKWNALDGGKLFVYNLHEDFTDSPKYSLMRVSEVFEEVSRKGLQEKINISLLRIVGISDPDGIRFTIPGPYPKTYIKDLSNKIVDATRDLIKEYVTPVHINLRLSSQDI